MLRYRTFHPLCWSHQLLNCHQVMSFFVNRKSVYHAWHTTVIQGTDEPSSNRGYWDDASCGHWLGRFGRSSRFASEHNRRLYSVERVKTLCRWSRRHVSSGDREDSIGLPKYIGCTQLVLGQLFDCRGSHDGDPFTCGCVGRSCACGVKLYRNDRDKNKWLRFGLSPKRESN